MAEETSGGGKRPGKPNREERLQARLRDNLKRRKEQARGRRDQSRAGGDSTEAEAGHFEKAAGTEPQERR